MKFTRNRQLYKMGLYKKGYIKGNLPISHMRKVREEIDKGFKWHRRWYFGSEKMFLSNLVSFYREGESYLTFVIKEGNCSE